MILEMALLSVIPGQECAFESAMRQARPLIAGSPGFRGMSISRGIESSSRYLLLVEWESVEAHEIGFRRSPAYRRWRELLHHFYDPFPTVEHYAPLKRERPTG
jgi:heme-degrading monooxygenase HmoA